MKALSLNDLFLALDRVAELTGDREFIIVGSIALLGSNPEAPEALRFSADIDLYPLEGESGDKNLEIELALGEASEFEDEHAFYIQGVGS